MGTSLALAAALLASPLPMQQQDPSPLTFRSAVTVRSVFVSVADERGRPAPGLAKGDFALLEDGVRREIAYFVPAERVPVDAILLIDASGSMAMSARLSFAKKAALAFIATLKPGDRAQIAAFSGRLDVLTPLTSDNAVLTDAVASIESWGATALYDSVYQVLRDLPAGTGRQRAIVVLSDGDDTASLLDFSEVLSRAQDTPSSVYAITPDERGKSARDLGRLAAETGGRLEKVKDYKDLPGIYARIAAELSSKYQLGFYPVDENGRSRVSVSVPKRRGLSVRATRAAPL